MSCCGRQRAAAASEGAGAMEQGAAVLFSYAGVQTIIVKGRATGRLYRFPPGKLLRVHGADAASMHGVPGLRPS
jgi:hypothetical protein